MQHTVFVTDQYGAKVLYDNEGLIGKFKDSYSNVITADDGEKRRVGKSLWFMVLDEADKIERAKSYPGFKKMFNIHEGEPVWNTLGNIKTLADPNAASAIDVGRIQANIEAKKDKEMEDIKNQLAIDTRRYGELFGLICKAGGDYLRDADPELIAEFEKLQVKLGIKELVVEE
jgi:hypothetical protein